MVKRKQERIYSRFLEQERIDSRLLERERIDSRLKELKEMESGFPPEKEELKDPAKLVNTTIWRPLAEANINAVTPSLSLALISALFSSISHEPADISEESLDKQLEPADTEETFVTSPQNSSISLGLQSLPSPETSPSSLWYALRFCKRGASTIKDAASKRRSQDADRDEHGSS